MQREITEITRQRIQLSRDYQEKIERMVTEIRSSEREQETHEISFLKSRIEELNEVRKFLNKQTLFLLIFHIDYYITNDYTKLPTLFLR